MKQYEIAEGAIAQKARSERLYLHYALLLAILTFLAGTLLVILGAGDHLDVLVRAKGTIEARFINASPGVVLWLLSGFVFWLSKPNRLRTNASHGKSNAEAAASLPAPRTLDINSEQIAEWETRMGIVRALGVSPDTGAMVRLTRWSNGLRLFDGEQDVMLPEGTTADEIDAGVALAYLDKRRRDVSITPQIWSRLVRSYGPTGKAKHVLTLREDGSGLYVTDGYVRAGVSDLFRQEYLAKGIAENLVELERTRVAKVAGELPDYVLRVFGISADTSCPIAICRGSGGSYRPYVTDGQTFAEIPEHLRIEYVDLDRARLLLSRARLSAKATSTRHEDPAGGVNVLYQSFTPPAPTSEEVATFLGDDA